MSEEESSVLFSLKELMTIEEDRIKTEEQETARAAAEAERARLEAERQAREAEEARKRAEEERRRAEEQRRREEAARLEAIQRAEVEKARAEAEQRARLEAMTAQQEHERQLAALNQDKGKKRLRNILIAGAAVVVLGGGTAGYFVWKNAEENAAIQAQKDAEAARLREEAEKKQRELEGKLAQISELEERIAAAAGNAEELERLQKQLAEAQKDAKDLSGGGVRRPGGGGKTGGTPAPAPKAGGCAPGDPLCSDI